MDSKRQQKVSNQIQQELSEIFRKQAGESPIKNTIITVTHAKVTSDLSICKVYLSVFPTENRERILSEIKDNTSLYRKYIGDKLGKLLRIIPNLQFYLDDTFDKMDAIDKEIKGLGNNPKL